MSICIWWGPSPTGALDWWKENPFLGLRLRKHSGDSCPHGASVAWVEETQWGPSKWTVLAGIVFSKAPSTEGWGRPNTGTYLVVRNAGAQGQGPKKESVSPSPPSCSWLSCSSSHVLPIPTPYPFPIPIILPHTVRFYWLITLLKISLIYLR